VTGRIVQEINVLREAAKPSLQFRHAGRRKL
jgi:hypothetical protein